jgi:hypothetical protein
MTLPPRLRKLVLTTHIVSSLGWFGAAAAYAGLVFAALKSSEVQQVRAACLAIEPITWFSIVPLALASLVTGLIYSLGTAWGLLRYYWVIYKLALTLFATTILFLNTRTLVALTSAARTAANADVFGLRGQLLHASLGMVVLLLTTVLGVYKPKGVTRYGWRKQHERAVASCLLCDE